MLDRSAIDFTPGLYQNDIYPDCTVVSIANMASARAAVNGYALYVDPTEVIDFFLAAAGDPSDPTKIDGLVYLDVINRQAAKGFFTGHDTLFGLPGTVGLTVPEIAAATNTLGSAGLGVVLFERDMDTFESGIWDVGTNDGAMVGRHALITWDYTGLKDTDLVRLGTWGTWKHATWRWVKARIDEAHGTRWPQLEKA